MPADRCPIGRRAWSGWLVLVPAARTTGLPPKWRVPVFLFFISLFFFFLFFFFFFCFFSLFFNLMAFSRFPCPGLVETKIPIFSALRNLMSAVFLFNFIFSLNFRSKIMRDANHRDNVTFRIFNWTQSYSQPRKIISYNHLRTTY